MSALDDRRYGISEVSRLIDVPVHRLRQWEDRFSPLRPKRDRQNRRYYTRDDVEIARRIKQLIRVEGLTTEGVTKQLRRELAGEGKPRTNHEALALLDGIESDVRELLDRLSTFDNDTT